VQEVELDAAAVRELPGAFLCQRDDVLVGAARGVETRRESRVCVVALSLRGVAAEPPGGNSERRRE
jgi:hypothetical protein